MVLWNLKNTKRQLIYSITMANAFSLRPHVQAPCRDVFNIALRAAVVSWLCHCRQRFVCSAQRKWMILPEFPLRRELETTSMSIASSATQVAAAVAIASYVRVLLIYVSIRMKTHLTFASARDRIVQQPPQ